VQHALLVPFPDLAPVVGPWLEQSVGSSPSQGVSPQGVSPHVTVLFPYPPPDDEVVETTRRVLEDQAAFDVDFREIGRFGDEVVYLVPDPAEPFVAAAVALARQFPDWPPYSGEYAEVTPHLTVAWGSRLAEAEAALRPLLPLHARAREAVLLSETEPGRWVEHCRFPFREP